MKSFIFIVSMLLLTIGILLSVLIMEKTRKRESQVESHGIVSRQIEDFGYGKVVEIYAGFSVILENASGERIAAYRGDKLPVRGDWYSLGPEYRSNSNKYYLYLKDRIYNTTQKTLEIDLARDND